MSVGSVDRALHNRPGISEQTKDKILRIARELRYQPNLPARSLVTGRTKTVGIVVFDLAHSYFSEVVTACISRLSTAGYFAYVAISNQDSEEELRCIDRMASLGVDGILIVPVNKGAAFQERLGNLNIPVISIGNRINATWPCISVDYARASEDAVDFLADRGYRRVIYLCPPLERAESVNASAVVSRAEGYRRAVQNHPELAPARIITGSDYMAEIKKLVIPTEVRTALLCTSDVFALKVYSYFSHNGISIPGDIGLMGFDNIGILQYFHPDLTTVDCSINETGIRSAECLLARFDGIDISPSLPHRVVVGETT